MPAATRTLNEVQTQITLLMQAMGTGTRRVRFADRETEFNSYSDMKSALADLRKEEAALLGAPVTKKIIFQTDPGF